MAMDKASGKTTQMVVLAEVSSREGKSIPRFHQD